MVQLWSGYLYTAFHQVCDLKAVHSTYHRLTDGLPTWVEQSKDTCSWSTFPTIIYLGLNHFFSFLVNHIRFSFAHIYSSSFIRCMLVVCMWLTLSQHHLSIHYYISINVLSMLKIKFGPSFGFILKQKRFLIFKFRSPSLKCLSSNGVFSNWIFFGWYSSITHIKSNVYLREILMVSI